MKNNVTIMLCMYSVSLLFVITTHSITPIYTTPSYHNIDSFGLLENIKTLLSRIEENIQTLNTTKGIDQPDSGILIELSKQHQNLKELILSLEQLLEQEESDDNYFNNQLQQLVADGKKALESKPFLTKEQQKELEQEKQENLFKKLTDHFNRNHEKVRFSSPDVD